MDSSPAIESDVPGTHLKRLEFIKDYACWGSKRATDLYQSTKGAAPEAIKPGLENLEAKIGEYAGPLYTRYEPEVPKLLTVMDTKVDETIMNAWNVYENRILPSQPVKMARGACSLLLSQTEKQMENLEHLREDYFKIIENTVEAVKKQGVAPMARDAAEVVVKAVSEARAAILTVDRAVLTERVTHVWAGFKDLAPVKHVVASYEPAIAIALDNYSVALKKITHDTRYANFVSKGAGMLESISANSAYQKRVAPYVTPYLAKITSSTYFSKLVDTLKPAVAAS